MMCGGQTPAVARWGCQGTIPRGANRRLFIQEWDGGNLPPSPGVPDQYPTDAVFDGLKGSQVV